MEEGLRYNIKVWEEEKGDSKSLTNMQQVKENGNENEGVEQEPAKR